MNPTPVVLYGDRVRLEPLDHRHADDLLVQAGSDDIWRFLPTPQPANRGDMITMIDRAWKAAAEGTEIPFAVVDDVEDKAVGSTRFLDIKRPDRALEVGWTWL